MTTVHVAEEHAGSPGEDPQLAAQLEVLRAALADHPFPTHQDDLIASCLALGVPSRACCRLALLDRTLEYASLDEVTGAIVRALVPMPGA
ncbi:hypothetical protein [Arthrobacter sp. NEB 688]|uniref:hypothetical protein n=1 Tax=Arthrobacter sp. NEB 688 TaxID=904039 RepID=UPI001565535A|nr:hypothetical protein [Arthrobacter sp. NEB 688]QKE83053.1 hypothetical protein HL663_03165 [Arthrobacter sp. NEB 688]